MAGKSDIEAGRAFVTTYVKNSQLLKGLNQIKAELQSVGSSVMKMGGVLTAAGSAITAPIMGAVNQFITMGTELQNISRRTGVGTTALAEFQYAAKQTGGSLGDVEGASKSATKAIADAAMGGQGAAIALSRLGLTAAGLKQQLPEDQLQTIADRLNGIKDPAQKAALATQLLGGTNLLPMIGQLGALRKEARDLGLAPSEKAVADAANLGRQIQRGLSVVTATIFEIGSAVSPVLFPIGEAIIRITTSVGKWVRENGELFRTIFKIGAVVVAVGAGITAVGAAIFGIGTVIGMVSSAIAGIGTAIGSIISIVSVVGGLILSPMGLVLAAVAGVTVLLLRNRDVWRVVSGTVRDSLAGIMAAIGPMVETVRSMVSGIGDALMAGDLQLAAQIAMKGLQLIFMQGVLAISELLGGQLGKTFGTIGSKVINGDFLGAWQTALKQLSAWHAAFVEGITAMWTAGARLSVEAWRQGVNNISDMLLESSAKGGVIGKFASMVLGVDMQAELARGKELDQKLGINSPDALAQAKEAARAQTDAIADGLKTQLDKIDLAAQARTDAAEEGLAKDTAQGGGLVDEIAALREQLAGMVKQAADARARVKPGGAGDLAGGVPGGGDIAAGAALRNATGTFSGVALSLMGNDGGIAKRQLRVIEDQRELQRKQLAEQEKLRILGEKQIAMMGMA